jgi:tRNA nucleotidyltransferase (CCA-adding enzyme)
MSHQPYPQAERLRDALVAARSVDAGAVAAQFASDPGKIKDAVHQARVAAVEAVLKQAASGSEHSRG